MNLRMALPKNAIDALDWAVTTLWQSGEHAPAQRVLYSSDDEAGSAAIANGPGGGSSGVTVSASAASPFIINISWNTSVAAAPAGFKDGVLAAVQYLQSQFTDAVTINISVGYGEVNGTALDSGSLGSSASFLAPTTYGTLRSAVIADAITADDKAAAASLPATSPVSGALWTTTADAKALGLITANGTATDGFVGFSSTLPFTYSGAIAAGSYDFNGVVMHELTEVMGRGLLTGSTVGGSTPSDELMDLFHFSAPGVREFSAGTPGYVSADGGATVIGTFNSFGSGDAGDWSSAMGNDAFNAFSSSGVVNPVSPADLRTVDIIGWNLASGVLLTGLKVSAATASLNAAQATAGLVANAALANITQIGGPSADSYSFALGGAGAASFKLTAAGTGATLSTTKNIGGAPGGKLYPLTITATDNTPAPKVSVTAALGVIVGTSAVDTINVATLAGALGSATACFVYGVGGNDTIDATGMTGRMSLVGGVGADRMTGGSGVNTYLYGAAANSTSASMDIITNFRATTDLIDLTGLGQPLAYAGRLTAGKTLAAHSVGYQITGGNTFVLVNTSGAAEALSATNMKIELLGSIGLASSNILRL
ncbi:MAG: NF038122 family metalloprotease [Alphaproteobacteria bacterium]|nr:NF038122 family metalloprotease [Alphaproteobacteria bacterium]